MAKVNVQAADLIAAARELIEQRGHWQGGREQGTTTCVGLAVADVGVRSGHLTVADAWFELNREAWDAGFATAILWNDHTPTEDVLLGMKRAEYRLRHES